MARSTKIINRAWSSPLPNPPPEYRRRGLFRAARGFTLIEGLIASVILAASVVGIGGALASSYQQNRVRGETNTAIALGQELMEDIAATPVDPPAQPNQPGWSSGQTDRTRYDTIDDYNGYTDTSDSIKAFDGSTLDLGNDGIYTRSVTVASNALPAGLTGTAGDFFLVTVTVKMPSGSSVAMSQLVTRVSNYR